ncbi:MAG: transposase [Clostridia bacterium]|nr:transposase [Clostridia bacterium]
MQTTYSFRIYPSKEQEGLMNQTIERCRQLYNAALEQRQIGWKLRRKSITYSVQQNELPALKQALPEFKNIQSQVLQDVLRRLDTAFQNFFEGRARYPRFKGKDHYNSFTYPQVDVVKKTFAKIEQGLLYLSKIGFVKINTHRKFDPTQVSRINIKRKSDGWYANLTCEADLSIVVNPTTQKEIGIDMGLNSFIATSEGELIANPRYLRKTEKYLKRMQRQLSRKQKGSKNRRKAKGKLAKKHLKVANQRKDFHHKLSNHLIKEQDLIAAEDLAVKNMARNHRLAKSIADAGWSQFLRYLEYKALKYGKRFVKVPPHGTSQTCICGAGVPKTLADRVHYCPECGLTGNRDIVSAKVILKRAQELAAVA